MPLTRIDDATAEPQSLDDILAWRAGVLDALDAQLGAVLQAVRVGAVVPDAFVGMSADEAKLYHAFQRRELDRLTIFNLVASAEASIRTDFIRRVSRKLKDPLSVAYRNWFSTLSDRKKERPDFDEGGILDLLKEHGGVDAHIVGRFRDCLKLRHWLGHGRFWKKPPAFDRLDLAEVYARAEAVRSAMPG